jgi:hypothetical protein
MALRRLCRVIRGRCVVTLMVGTCIFFFNQMKYSALIIFYILINCCILKRFLFAISDQKQTVWLLDEKAIYFFNEQHTQENIIRLIRKDFSGFLTKGKSCSVETN